jgi:hypothetical protein
LALSGRPEASTIARMQTAPTPSASNVLAAEHGVVCRLPGERLS